MGPQNDGVEKEFPDITILRVHVAFLVHSHNMGMSSHNLGPSFPPFLLWKYFGVPNFETQPIFSSDIFLKRGVEHDMKQVW